MALTLKFKTVSKDRLFYDRYRYCIGFTLEEVSCLRELDHDYIDAIIARRRMWRETTKQRWSALHGTVRSTIIPVITGRIHPSRTILAPKTKPITDENIENLHTLAETLIKTTSDFKLVTSVESAWVYTNSLTLLKKLKSNQTLKRKVFTEAVINRPKNTVVLKDSKYTHRSYFKTVKLTPEEKVNIVNFLNNQTGHIRVSPSMLSWAIESPFYRLQDYFFIDHNGETWILMLALIKSGIIRKTLDIITDK